MASSKVSPVDKSIVLIGFMGVGKTTIGEVAAKKLGRTFVDVDAEIERSYHMSIPQMFESLGEKKFRSIERELTLRHCSAPGKVISLGGGAFLNDEVRHACIANCTVFHLDLSWEKWKVDRYQKISDSRPVLQGMNQDEMKRLFDARKPLYGLHHYTLPLDRFDIDQAADFIVESVCRDMLVFMKDEFTDV